MAMQELGSDLRWGARRRLEFLEFQLFWYGRFNRGDLAATFEISTQQASADIAYYQKAAPNNLRYDNALKSYVRTSEFEPLLIGDSADRYLLQLVAISTGWMKKKETWFDVLPEIEVVGLERHPTNHKNLLAILDAVRSRHELPVLYHSMTGTSERSRMIAPHAIAYSAGRWYIRSWSRDHNDFRDYNLSRIKDVGDSHPCDVDQTLDYEWHQKIDLILVPNPKLPLERKTAVEVEYGMRDGSLIKPVRLSLSFYLMSEFNLDVPEGRLEPLKQQLILKNRDDVEQARRLARQMSSQALARVKQA